MSVLVPDHKVFSYIYSGMRIAATRTVCDAKYSHVIRSYFQHHDLDTESKRLVRSWLRMCEQSYNKAYKSEGLTDHLLRLQWVEFTPVQLLKYLECLTYNIELPGIQTPQEQKDYDLLEYWERDLSKAILHQLPEYKEGKWSEA